MSNSWSNAWSNDVDAPQISRYEYTQEKTMLAGSFIGSILYGLTILLFFQCMAALLNPVYRRGEGIKWWLVFHTVAMFSFVTVYTATTLHIQSNSFIDHREGHPTDVKLTSGPLNYQQAIRKRALGLVPNVMFSLNNWLADGLLIYRCYVIYSTNLWAIALPCLLYLASLGMGIVMLYSQSHGTFMDDTPVYSQYGIPYLSISVSLNVLLTLMIVIRLILHDRSIRAATGSGAGIGGFYKAVSTMLIESCALFAVSSLVVVVALFRATSTTRDVYYPGIYVVDIVYPILVGVQVIAPLLIVQRVANRSALTSHTINAGHVGLFNPRRQGGPTGGDGTPLGGYLMSSAGGYGKSRSDGVTVETTIDLHPDGEALRPEA